MKQKYIDMINRTLVRVEQAIEIRLNKATDENIQSRLAYELSEAEQARLEFVHHNFRAGIPTHAQIKRATNLSDRMITSHNVTISFDSLIDELEEQAKLLADAKAQLQLYKLPTRSAS